MSLRFGGVFGCRGRNAILMLALRSSSSAAEQACSASDSPLPYTLTAKRQLSPDSYLLRYSLPKGRRRLGEDPTLPTCIKVFYPDGTDEKTGEAKPLEKSYSPVTHPSVEGFVELIVKSYPPRAGGGVGSFLCGMQVGETMLGTVKGKRVMHGSAAVLGRWTNIGLVAGGTGIAPLLQIARLVLESRNPVDASTKVHLLFTNRREEDILARVEIENLASLHPERFLVAYSLTGVSVPESLVGHTGRGDGAMVASALPPPTGDGKTMILVCGTDGFVATWAGPVGRAPKKPDGSKGGKIQGPLLGLLKEAGYTAEEVFKY
jgi:cytochrome-b5 reductase